MKTMRFHKFGMGAAAVVMMLAAPAMAQYVLEIEASPEAGGLVSSYEEDGFVTVTASPTNGYEFVGWEGDIVASSSSMTFQLVDDTYLVAVFAEATPPGFKLTAFVDPSGAGTIIREPAEFEYADGAEVTLSAYANPGFVFSGWEGDLPEGADAADSVLTVVMDGDLDIEATFAAAQTLDDSAGLGGTACGAVGTVGFGLMLSLMAMMKLGRSRF